MNIEVGKKYITENGSLVTIKYNTDALGYELNIRPFGGVIEGRGAMFYTANGIYNVLNPNSGFNILKEVQ